MTDIFKNQKEKQIYKNAKAIELIKAIAAESSTNAKKILIEKSSVNSDFMLIIKKALDPYVNFYIKKWPEVHSIKGEHSDMSIRTALRKFEQHLESGATRGKAAEKLVCSVLEQLDAYDAEAVALVLKKDLRAGFSAKLVNAVLPGTIPEYSCMNAQKADSKTIQNIIYPAYVQTKVDALRMNLIIKNNIVTCRTRIGKQLNIAHYFSDIIKLKLPDLILDGEIVILDDNGKPLPRQISNGIVTKWSNGNLDKEPNAKFVVWDAIPYQSFIQGEYSQPYSTRLKVVENIVKKYNNPKIRMIDSNIVNNEKQVQALFREALLDGEEGIMLKNMNMPFENKRSSNQLKYKLETINEMEIIDIVEGKGKRLGKLGAFVAQSKDGLIKCDIGSGLSDIQIEEYFNQEMIGKIISVKHNGKIINSHGEVSLFLPVFIEVREDKEEADNSRDFV